MKGSRAFVVIAIISVWVAAMSGLLSQPVYANFCAANIKSTPPEADVYIDGVYMGKTPFYYEVGDPFTANVTVTKEGYQKWSKIVVVPLDVVLQVNAELAPLAEGAVTLTKTVTTTVTTTRQTTITTTTTATTTSSTTVSTTITSTSLSATTQTVTSEVTEQVGMPVELTYGAIGVAVIAVIASAIIATRRRS